MSTTISDGVYVCINQLDGYRAPSPLPLQSGFNLDTAYRVLGISNPSESSDAYFILCNDVMQTWFICTRHCMIHSFRPDECALFIEKGNNV